MVQVIIGLGTLDHDSSACLLRKDTLEIVYAASEERLSNIKHDSHFPVGVLTHCLNIIEENGYDLTDIVINFNDRDFITGTLASEIRNAISDEQIAEDLVAAILAIYDNFCEYYCYDSISRRLIDQKIDRASLPKSIKKSLQKRLSWFYNWGIKYRNIFHSIQERFPGVAVHRLNHHLCHAAGVYLNSGFDDAAILIIDGQGESNTVSIFRGDENGVHRVATTNWPYSLGSFYLMATYHLGFGFGDEYKVMGMAAYGEPKYYDLLKQIVRVTDDGQICFNKNEYFKEEDVVFSGFFYHTFSKRFQRIIPRRNKNQPITKIHFDFAASIQKIVEDSGVELAKTAIKLTGSRNIAISGGVGLNGLMNEKIRQQSGCLDIFIYPAASDDGTSVGGAQYIAFMSNGVRPPRLMSCYYGYSPREGEILSELESRGLVYSRPDSIHKEIAAAVAQNKIVARYVGKSEFGPRALGNRSILANPKEASMKSVLNERIKHREPFRPFAPACLRDRVSEYFEIARDSPFMLLICKATEKAEKEIPAVVHNDGTARVQTITAEANPDFYATILEFEKITKTPVIINTSFNVNGEAIVDTPADAIESFGFMDIDYLAIGDYWVSKEKNMTTFPKLTHDQYLDLRKKRYALKGYGPLTEFDNSRISYSFFVDNDYYSSPRISRLLIDRIRKYVPIPVLRI